MSRTKTQYRSASREAYDNFIKEYPQYKHISVIQWRKIIYEINWAYRDYILQSGDKVKLPYGFGDISINRKKRKTTSVGPDGKERITLPIDWVKTKKAGKYIYNFNHHTDGYFYGWIYFRNSGRMKFNSLWDFFATRDSSRLLAKYIKTPDSDYKYLYKEYLRYK